MKAKTLTVTGNTSATAASTVLVMDYNRNPFYVGIGVETDGTQTGFKVQHTFDGNWHDVDFNSSTDVKWFDHTDHGTVQTADDFVKYDFPVVAVRILLDTGGTDTITAQVVQAGIRGS